MKYINDKFKISSLLQLIHQKAKNIPPNKPHYHPQFLPNNPQTPFSSLQHQIISSLKFKNSSIHFKDHNYSHLNLHFVHILCSKILSANSNFGILGFLLLLYTLIENETNSIPSSKSNQSNTYYMLQLIIKIEKRPLLLLVMITSIFEINNLLKNKLVPMQPFLGVILFSVLNLNYF